MRESDDYYAQHKMEGKSDLERHTCLSQRIQQP